MIFSRLIDADRTAAAAFGADDADETKENPSMTDLEVAFFVAEKIRKQKFFGSFFQKRTLVLVYIPLL